MSDEENRPDPPLIFCKGCGTAFKGKYDGPVHRNDSCWILWERSCLLEVEGAARELLRVMDGEVGDPEFGADRMRDALNALDECRERND